MKQMQGYETTRVRKKSQLEVLKWKNMKLKNPIYVIHSKLDRAEEKISELEDGTG